MKGKLGVSVSTLVVALAAASPASAAPQVSGSFSVPGLNIDSQIVQGPDGNMWATTPDSGTTDDVARINSQTGAVTKFNLDDVDGPVGITRQGNNLWVTATNKVGRFTAANPSDAVPTTVNEIGSPRGITLGPDGNLWAVSDTHVVEIPPGNPGGYTDFPTLINTARQVTPGAGNTLWATGGTQVIHFTTAGAQAAGSPYTFGGGPQGIAAGAGGQVAFGNPVDTPQRIGRITPPGDPQLTDLGQLDAGFGVTFGNDGAYWISQYNGNNLRRFTPQGQSTFLGGFPAFPNRGPRYLAKGPNNTLWVNLDVPGDATNDRVARVTGVAAPAPPPAGCSSNEFTLEGVDKNKKKGTAEQTVLVPCPGDLALEGKKVKSVTQTVEAATAAGLQDAIEATLKVKPNKKTKKKLKKKGKAKVKMDVTFTPTGGEPNTQGTALKLKKKRH